MHCTGLTTEACLSFEAAIYDKRQSLVVDSISQFKRIVFRNHLQRSALILERMEEISLRVFWLKGLQK